LFDHTDLQFGEAIPIFMEQLADEIVYRTKQIVKNPQRITAFTEFFGPGSFAGAHVATDPKELRLFDVFLFQKGFVSPKQFVEVYGELPQAAEVVYEGPLNRRFVTDVRDGKYPVFEGVVAKGNDFSVKIKTDEYFRALRHRFPERWEEYGE
jgi:hypothetical protein